MSEPYGPTKISGNRQVALPKALMDRLNLRPEDSVYFLADERVQGALLVVPVERISEWIRRGREHESADSESVDHER
ncbi:MULTISPECIES: AbrB/MazE/SpoVT family DNA-binding domain-containing protein [Mycobacteriaceae]|uniref:AbrB/MazE/SpoVT family DNA-binding domain-containing protein n=1 Tax=Mycobacteriaceae TaxID=1762 RepID=UPI0009F3985C|nr:AbrB/MazE/SpoVT family DNA-binding domain-containing protein [Mycolicibacterium mucogenicum]